MKPLENRVALVTGVSRRAGIGYAIARHLLSFGADVFVHHYAPFDEAQPWGGDSIPALIEKLRQVGPRVENISADFSDPFAPQQVIQEALDAYDHIDILVSNHAYSTMGDLAAISAQQIDMHMAVNVRATLLLIKHFAAQHDGRNGGRVLLLTSGQHLGPMPDELAYVASKGALHQLTQSLSHYLLRQRITVNTVNPGATDTGYASEELRQAIIEQSPQGRWGEPTDAARLIAWLATDDARWITGQVINSTGGL